MTLSICCASWATMSRGVPLGASRPDQELKPMPSTPASLMVGTWGKTSARWGSSTASALTLPVRIISTEVKESNEKSTSPATTACICGAVPLYWALTMPGAPITFLNCSVISEIMLLPEDTLNGLPCLARSEEHTSELQSPDHLLCRLLLEKKKKHNILIS